MFDTSIYNRDRSYNSGFNQGQGLRSAVTTEPKALDEKSALEAIQSGQDVNMVIANLQKTNPTAAQSIMQMLGIGGSGGADPSLASMAMQAGKVFFGGF